MEKTNTRLHPLLTAAAISVSVFSAVGVATLTGLVPQSIGSQKEPAALEVPRDSVKTIEAAPAASEAAAAVEAPRPAKPRVARKAAPKPAVPASYQQLEPAPQLAQAPQVVQAPKPAAAIGLLATVEDVKEVTTPGEHTAIGPIAGGVAGAVIGSQIGGGNGKKIATVLGALGGAMAGKHIEKRARGEKHWETVVRLEDGSQRTVQSAIQPFWHAGDRVRYVDGALQPV
jgi:outer membrane lipoprotein SlyB